MTALKQLLDQACDNELELRRLHSSDGNLTAKAYLEAVAAVPGTSEKEVLLVEKALQGHDAAMLSGSFRRMLRAIETFKRTGPIKQLAPYLDGEADAVLGRLGCTRQSLFYAAARRATERKELFGACTVPGQLDADVKALIARRHELHAEIEQNFTAGDLLLEDNGARFRIAPPVAVAAGFAERLINFRLAELAQDEAA